MLVAVFSLAGGSPSSGQDIRFAQITDVHIIEAAVNDTTKGDSARNLRGFEWAVDEINRRGEAGPAYDFVAFTGDLPLEAVLKSIPALQTLSKENNGQYGRLYEVLNKSFAPDHDAASA